MIALCECGAPARGRVCQRGHRLSENWASFDASRGHHAFEGVVKMNRVQALNVLEGVGVGTVDPTDLRHDEIEHLRNSGASFLIDAERRGIGAATKAKRVREGLKALPRVHSLHPSMRERVQMLTEDWARFDAFRGRGERKRVLGSAIERDKTVLDHLAKVTPYSMTWDTEGHAGSTPEGLEAQTGVPADHVLDMVDRGVLRQGKGGLAAQGEWRRPWRKSTMGALRDSYRHSRPVVAEAKAAGAEHTRFDGMDEDALREQIGKYKAMGDKAPAAAMIRASQALARKLALREAVFDPFKHPRARGGKFARKAAGAVADAPGGDRRQALHDEWDRIENELNDYLDAPTGDDANRLIDRQIEITHELHHMTSEMPHSPGTTAHDVVIVGAGPAGLAGSIYAGYEHLDTVMVDGAPRPGGQAAKSTRIENVPSPGFTAGFKGRKYGEETLREAERQGVDARLGKRAVALTNDPGSGVKTLTLDDGSEVRGRTVIIAGGLMPRHLGLAGEDDTPEVFYGDPDELAKRSDGAHVVIVGGANSAGQAAVAAARRAEHVTILLRHGELGDKMSASLVRQVEAQPNIVAKVGTIDELNKDEAGRLQSVALKDGSRLKAHTVNVMAGSAPSTDWLSGIERNERGFVKAGEEGRGSLETNMPGVFAAGDVREDGGGRVLHASDEGAHAVEAAQTYLSRLDTKEAKMAKANKPKPKRDGTDDFMDRVRKLDSETPFFGLDHEGNADVAEALLRTLRESWEQWDAARKAGEFSHAVKAGPMPGGVKDSPGRGPSGKLRNFEAMSPPKLTETLKALKLHGEDPEAHKAAMAVAAEKLGVEFDDDGIHIPAKHVAGAQAGGQLLIQ